MHRLLDVLNFEERRRQCFFKKHRQNIASLSKKRNVFGFRNFMQKSVYSAKNIILYILFIPVFFLLTISIFFEFAFEKNVWNLPLFLNIMKSIADRYCRQDVLSFFKHRQKH